MKIARDHLTASIWAAIRALGDESVSDWMELQPSGLVPWGRIAQWTPEQLRATAVVMSEWVLDGQSPGRCDQRIEDLVLVLNVLTWEDLSFRHWMALEIAFWATENGESYREQCTDYLSPMVAAFRDGIEHGFYRFQIERISEIAPDLSRTAQPWSHPTNMAAEMAKPFVSRYRAPENLSIVCIALEMSMPQSPREVSRLAATLIKEHSQRERLVMLKERLASRTLEMLESIARVRSKELSPSLC